MKSYTQLVDEVIKIITDQRKLMDLVKDILSEDVELRDEVNAELPVDTPIDDGEVNIGDLFFHHSYPEESSWSNVSSVTVRVEINTEEGVADHPITIQGHKSARLIRQLSSRMKGGL